MAIAKQVELLFAGVQANGKTVSNGTVSFVKPDTNIFVPVYLDASADPAKTSKNPVPLDFDAKANVFINGIVDIVVRDKAGVVVAAAEKWEYKSVSEQLSIGIDPTADGSPLNATTLITLINNSGGAPLTIFIVPEQWLIDITINWPANSGVFFLMGASFNTLIGITNNFQGDLKGFAFHHLQGQGTYVFSDKINELQSIWLDGVTPNRRIIRNITNFQDDSIFEAEARFQIGVGHEADNDSSSKYVYTKDEAEVISDITGAEEGKKIVSVSESGALKTVTKFDKDGNEVIGRRLTSVETTAANHTAEEIERTSSSPANFDSLRTLHKITNDALEQVVAVNRKVSLDDITDGLENSSITYFVLADGLLHDSLIIDPEGISTDIVKVDIIRDFILGHVLLDSLLVVSKDNDDVEYVSQINRRSKTIPAIGDILTTQTQGQSDLLNDFNTAQTKVETTDVTEATISSKVTQSTIESGVDTPYLEGQEGVLKATNDLLVENNSQITPGGTFQGYTVRDVKRFEFDRTIVTGSILPQPAKGLKSSFPSNFNSSSWPIEEFSGGGKIFLLLEFGDTDSFTAPFPNTITIQLVLFTPALIVAAEHQFTSITDIRDEFHFELGTANIVPFNYTLVTNSNYIDLFKNGDGSVPNSWEIRVGVSPNNQFPGKNFPWGNGDNVVGHITTPQIKFIWTI